MAERRTVIVVPSEMPGRWYRIARAALKVHAFELVSIHDRECRLCEALRGLVQPADMDDTVEVEVPADEEPAP